MDNTQNLDLNTTARKNEKTVERASPYLINATYSVIIANLARQIGPFDERVELEKWRAQRAADKAAAEGITPAEVTMASKPGSPELGSDSRS